MAELFLELFSEEIPARMQARAADDLARLMTDALAGLTPKQVRTWYGPRRLALAVEVEAQVAAVSSIERGPRTSAPEQALMGFLRKHNAIKDQARQEGDYWVLEKTADSVAAPVLIASAVPGVLRKMPWPKSMRWGGTSHFTWVRPLRRIVCLLDGAVVPFDLRDGADDGHGLASGDLTEGHRFHAPGAFAVSGAADWAAKLRDRRVLVDVADRKAAIANGIATIAAARGIAVVEDAGLLDEVAGLVEWPVPLAGRIAAEHMDLPPEVMQVSMRINQRYFATRTPDGKAAPWFIFAANVEADDGGAAIVAGNERVLRARFADARHFWDLDRKARLESLLPKLENVTYHASLGSQWLRVLRLQNLARVIAPCVGASETLADKAAELAKADLVSGMVGEFPELQGVMGRYYALGQQADAAVADAIRDHYAPRGPSEKTPSAPVSVTVALADKLEHLHGFWSTGERPTGSGDPYALRRAALGVVRIIRDNRIRMPLRPILASATQFLKGQNRPIVDADMAEVILDFIVDRLFVQLRTEGLRHDILAAMFVFSDYTDQRKRDDDITRLLARTASVAAFLGQDAGVDLLAAYKRAANILRDETGEDGRHTDRLETKLLVEAPEQALHQALGASETIKALVTAEDFTGAMTEMARLRGPLDAFLDGVTVYTPELPIRRNRLRLLNQVRTTMDRVADFSRIEG